MNNDTFTINGQQIPYWLFGRMIKKYGKRQTFRIFYQIKDKDDIKGYALKCIKNNWFTVQSVEMEKVKQVEIDAWVDVTFRNKKPEPKPVFVEKSKKPESIGSILKTITKGV